MSRPVRISVAEGAYLQGDYVPGSQRKGMAVLWIHGFGSTRRGEKSEALRKECWRRNWAFARFDFRGHGNSTGTMRELTTANLLEDLAAIRRFLEERGHTQLALVGSSMGGFAAAWFTLKNPKAAIACIFLAPAFRFLQRRWASLGYGERELLQRKGRFRIANEWIDVEIGSGLVRLQDRRQYCLESLAAEWKTPALLFHGMADDAVPPDDSLEFIRLVNGTKVQLRLFNDGEHRLTPYKNEIASEACRFIEGLSARTTKIRKA